MAESLSTTSAELLINVTPPETRVALVENGVLQEIHIERTSKRGRVGNIYRGRVQRVLPGMQAAFVDIGLERAAFLHASDIHRSHLVMANGTDTATGPHEPDDDEEDRDITALVTEGQSLVVQVVKDPIGSKGARLTTHLSIPSRYLVYLPQGHGVGVSQKIEDEDERARLRSLVAGLATSEQPGGIIVRTAAEGVSDDALGADLRFLQRLWVAVRERCQTATAPARVHEDLPLVLRALRDLFGPQVEQVRVDSRESFQRAVDFATRFIPEVRARIDYYPGERPIFDLYGIEDEIHKALDRRVELKSGGHLVIDQTEAMTTIDVNTGAFVGHRNLEETIFKTNFEAAQAIARQLRLRNLGGIIIIDFIDMADPEHRRQILRSLERALARDPARCHVSAVSALGLVEMTRKRTRESLERVLCEPCPTCAGRGTMKTAESTCYEIFREILREARQYDADALLVLAAQAVVDRLLDEESNHLAELEAFIGKPIRFQPEALYTQEQYDVVPI